MVPAPFYFSVHAAGDVSGENCSGLYRARTQAVFCELLRAGHVSVLIMPPGRPHENSPPPRVPAKLRREPGIAACTCFRDDITDSLLPLLTYILPFLFMTMASLPGPLQVRRLVFFDSVKLSGSRMDNIEHTPTSYLLISKGSRISTLRRPSSCPGAGVSTPCL